MEKNLIVNGDDFGASAGINRGIVESHARGIVTSTSLMVTGRAAREAAAGAGTGAGIGGEGAIDALPRSSRATISTTRMRNTYSNARRQNLRTVRIESDICPLRLLIPERRCTHDDQVTVVE